jgi:hypothetical protein
LSFPSARGSASSTERQAADRGQRRPPAPNSVYLQGIDNAEIIETVHARRAPMIPVSPSLRP